MGGYGPGGSGRDPAARRWPATVALLVTLASVPTWVVVTAGSAILDHPARPAGTTPFIAVPSGAPVVVVPAAPRGPGGSDAVADRSGADGGGASDTGTRGDHYRHWSRPRPMCVPVSPKLGWRPMGISTLPCPRD